MNKVLLQLF